MANDLRKRLAKQQEVPFIELRNLSGLSLKLDPRNRPKNTFQVLDNFRLDTEGSLTKVASTILLSGPAPASIVDVIEFAPNPAGTAMRIVAYGITDRNLYDCLTNAPTISLYASTAGLITGPNTAIPFMAQMPGVLIPYNVRSWKATTSYQYRDAVIKYSAADGNLYVFYVTTPGNGAGTASSGSNEPIWPASGTVTDAGLIWTNGGIITGESFRVNYLIVAQQGNQPIKVTEYSFSDNLGVHTVIDISQVGVSAPRVPIEVEVIRVTPNQNGYIPQAGRAFCWTWYNPRTLHESSPSPIAGTTKVKALDQVFTINGNPLTTNVVIEAEGSLLPPLPQPVTVNGAATVFSSYQCYSLSIPAANVVPAIGTGFTHLRFYATKDGGSQFFLLTNLMDVNENLLSNSDGAVLIADLLASGETTDYVPLPTPQNQQTMITVYDGGGPINLAPDPFNLSPAAWSPGYGGDILTVVPGDAPDGAAAIEYAGTGMPSKVANYASAKIPVSNGTTYSFSGYMDNTAGSGATIQWRVTSGDNAITYLTLSMNPGSAGTVTGSFTKHADGHLHVRLRAHLNAGDTVPLGSIVFWSDPVFVVGAVVPDLPTTYPQPDNALVIPAPAFGANDPPPVSAGLGAVYQNSLFLVDDRDRSKLVYSSINDFESFPVNSFQYLPSGRATDPIMALESTYDRVIIGRQRSVFQGTGPAPSFVITPVDARHGLMAYRGMIPVGSALVAWLIDGLAEIGLGLDVPAPSQINVGFRSEALIGDPILPLLQTALRKYLTFDANSEPGIPCMAIGDVDNNLFLLMKTQ